LVIPKPIGLLLAAWTIVTRTIQRAVAPLLMPNLDVELEHLRLADEHIATAGRSISVLELTLAADAAAGTVHKEGQAALLAACDGLEVFQAHRDLILATISDIQTGRLPTTS
jgi:hypothetical protein